MSHADNVYLSLTEGNSVEFRFVEYLSGNDGLEVVLKTGHHDGDWSSTMTISAMDARKLRDWLKLVFP